MFTIKENHPAIQIVAPDKRYFEVKIVDGGIITSGNLEPDDAARIFMETVGHLILDKTSQGN